MGIVRFALVSLFLFFLLYLINYSTFVFLSRETEYQTQNSFPSTLVRKMHLNMLDATLSSFDQVFERFKSDAPKHQVNLILFLADKDPSTSLSWCPDCVRAEPVIYKKLEASTTDVVLLRAFVGDRPTWRNPLHPWRVDSRFKLKGVPTLVRWENDAITGRLEDDEAHLEHKIDGLISGK